MPAKKAFNFSEISRAKSTVLKKLIVDFTIDTTCHGMDQVSRPGRPSSVRILWLLIILGLTGGLCWQLSSRFSEYLLYISDTELNEQFVSKAEFPAVSICNYNRFFNITEHDELAALEGLIRLTSPMRKKKNDFKWERYIRNYYNRPETVPYLSKDVTDKGWPLNDNTILSCLFTQKPCSAMNFTTFLTPMGQCFTFTSNKKMVQSVPGSGHGLLLKLNIMQNYYSEHPEFGRPEAGIKVHVHEHNEPPMVEEFGVAIPAGHMGHLIIRKTERHLMYKPWGICNPDTKKMSYREMYTFGECMTECRCKPYWSPPQEPAPECNIWQILDCAGDAEAESMKLTPDDCNCDQSCDSVSYDHKLSYSTYPSLEVGEVLAHRKENKVQSESKEIVDVVVFGKELNLTEADPYRLKLSDYRENYLMLDVFYETLSYTEIKQSKKISENSLISDIGGLLGLWLGISIVTLIEFIQFLIEIGCNYFDAEDDNTTVKSISVISHNVSKVTPSRFVVPDVQQH